MMEISAINSLSSLAVARAGQKVDLQISKANHDRLQNLEKTRSLLLSRMLKGMSLDGTGMLVDLFA